MAICPACEGVFPEGTELCQFDHTRLVDGPMCSSCQLEHAPGQTQCRVCEAALRPPQPRRERQEAATAPSLGRPPLTPSLRPGADPGSPSPLAAPVTVASPPGDVSPTSAAPAIPAPVPSVGGAGGPRPPGLGTGPLEMPPRPGAAPPGAAPPTGLPPPPTAPPRPPGMGGGVPPPELAAIPGMPLRAAMPLPTAAGFGSRAIAFLIDQAIVQGIPFALTMFGVIGATAAAGEGEPSDTLMMGVTAAYYVILALVGLGNFVLLQGLCGQSVGKMALGLKVVKEDGEPIGVGWALLRYICYSLLSPMPCGLGLGFWWALWDDKGQTWHDKVCRTVVTLK